MVFKKPVHELCLNCAQMWLILFACIFLIIQEVKCKMFGVHINKKCKTHQITVGLSGHQWLLSNWKQTGLNLVMKKISFLKKQRNLESFCWREKKRKMSRIFLQTYWHCCSSLQIILLLFEILSFILCCNPFWRKFFLLIFHFTTKQDIPLVFKINVGFISMIVTRLLWLWAVWEWECWQWEVSNVLFKSWNT